MSDPVTNFESILRKQCSKTSKSLYKNNKQQNKPIFTPKDVISSVSSQLRAINVADTYKRNIKSCVDLKRYKSSTYLCVNKLPTYEEPPKQPTKFDTQCVTDTQLINIIEDAEIVDKYQGMTDAFDTPFSQLNTEKQCHLVNEERVLDNNKSDFIDVIKVDAVKQDAAQDEVNVIEEDHKQSAIDSTKSNVIDTGEVDVKQDTGQDVGNIIIEDIIVSKNFLQYDKESNSVNNDTGNNIFKNNSIGVNKDEKPIVNTLEEDSQVEQFSQILGSKTVNQKFKPNKAEHDKLKPFKPESVSQMTEDSQILNQCQDIEMDNDRELTPSPVFPNRNIKTKSKTPSPLVFNLDKFEHFESIAISLIETNDFDTAKHLINSQILDKELHIKMDEDIELNERHIPSPVIEENLEDNSLGSPVIEIDEKVFEIDKATSEEIMKVTSQDTNVKMNNSEDVFKDEILFSSDEEDYVHKELQDLPFTCALETSFYDQSDVLDKTMYVGFQTASNRSIQISADSFVKAKTILNDVANEDVTVTDLVKNCDNSLKDTDRIEQITCKGNDDELNSSRQKTDYSTKSELKLSNTEKRTLTPSKNSNFMGFTTANNKKINLSEKALARCRKVFQDIDLSQNFDTVAHEDLPNDLDIKSCRNNAIEEKTDIKNPMADVLQGIDEDVLQEFENIEMSLENKELVDKVTTIGFKTASNKDIRISDVALETMKNVFKDIDLKEINDNDPIEDNNLNTEDVILSQIISKPRFKDESKSNIANSTPKAKSKDIFESIDGRETLNKLDQNKLKCRNLLNIEQCENTIEVLDINQPSTSKGFVGFKTANNRNINISEKAWHKSKNIFNDIDSIDLPSKANKEYPNIDNTQENKAVKKDLNNIDKKSVGFKTANNRNIAISKEAVAKSKNIFSDTDSSDLSLPIKMDKPEIPATRKEKSNDGEDDKIKPNVAEFQSAGTGIKISNRASARMKNIFKNIEPLESKVSTERLDKDKTINATKQNAKVSTPYSAAPNFVGFKTANNKGIKISKEALTKTKNIFNDIDAIDLKLANRKLKDYPDLEERQATKQDISSDHKIQHDSYNEGAAYITEKHLEVPKFQGFKTASNKQVKVSTEALIKSKNMFKDINETDFKIPDKKLKLYPDEVEHLKNENNQLSNKVETKLKTSMVNAEDDNANKIIKTQQFQGFKTASNKQVNISKEALIKSKNLFKDIDATDFIIPDKALKDYPGQNHTTSNVGDNLNVPQFRGFQTASNKEVKISKEALLKSKNIFKDIDCSTDCDVDTNTEVKDVYPEELINNDDVDRPASPIFKGFQTANKRPVTVSAKAVEKSKKLFEDMQTSDSTGFKGFHTASNKNVKISATALAKTRNIFKDIDTNDSVSNTNKSTKAKGLYPKEIYQREENFDDVSGRVVLSGFQTGNNKIVNVTERALTETKNLFGTDKSIQTFKGFETASNKKVIVSEEALAKTKKVFQDIDTGNEGEEAGNSTAMKFKMAFQTGSSKLVTVSNEAMARSKRLFSEIDDNENNTDSKKYKMETNKTEGNDDIHAIIDTQVMNNFEESLYTEDFRETPRQSKKSGSPILSCPRAKKRKKFETPYNVKKIPKTITKVTETKNIENKLTFREDYKKNKKYTLKDIQNMTRDVVSKIDPYLIFEYDNLLQFEFKYYRNDISSENMTIELLKERFLNSVNAKLIPNGWLDNHLKLILWKLISYEVKFKCLMCTVRNVIDQLKYRYDRELYNAQRPALRKIFEKDDVPSKTLVLCVAGIYVDGVRVASVTDCQSNMELLLTDGWYSIRCVIDKMLTQLVCAGRIAVGSKIVTSGAELTGCEQGVSPWEDTSGVRLKISGNSTRRARWDARLGYHGNCAMLSQLSRVTALGGRVAKLRVFVARVYPPMYVEKFEDGSTVTRSERLENLHQMKVEAERQALIEKIYEDVEAEFADKDTQDSEGLPDLSRRSSMESGSQIAIMMKRSKDPAEFRAALTHSQTRLLEAHTSSSRDRLLHQIQETVRERVEKSGVCVNRNVVTLLKIRVAGLEEKGDRIDICKGMMSIWKPNECMREIVKEGAWIDVLNVVPTAIRYSEIQISAGRQSIFSASKFKPSEKIQPYTKLLQRQCYSINDLAQNPGMSTDYNEIDTVGLIFLIDPSMELFDSAKQSFQNIYLTDAEKNIICVNFWGGLKKFGFQNVLDTGQVVTCVNLQKRAGNTRKTIPQYRVTELSYFTQTPKSECARKMLIELNKKIVGLDRRKICEDCVILKNNYSIVKQNNENVSPYRFMNNSEMNMSKNKMFIDSPLTRNKADDIFNLTGLDFESTFKQDTELSEEVLKRKRKVNEKIARLKMYGEPPPLSPLHIINRSKQATSSYKSPLLQNNNNSSIKNEKGLHSSNLKNNDSDSSSNVANLKNTPQKCGEIDSEVSTSPILNRTYVKSVNINPIKINFDMKDNDSNVDHFADEFDGSPPLSLD